MDGSLRSRRSLGKKLAFAAATVLLGLLALEGALRLLGLPRGLVRSFSRAWNRDPESLARLPGLFQPSAELAIAVPPELAYRVRTNALGLRGPELGPRTPGTLRVLALGDSVTFGYHVADGETWPALLEARLRGGGRAAEVINGGCGHFSLPDERLYATERLLSLEPDVVVLQFCSNDVLESELLRDPPLYRKILAEAAEGTSLGDRLRGTALGELQLRVAIALKGAGHEPAAALSPLQEVGDAAWARWEEELAGLAAELAARRVPLVLVSFPDLVTALEPASQGYDARLAAIAARQGVPFRGALQAFRTAGPDPRQLYLWPRDAHPCGRGTAVLSGVVGELLRERGLLAPR